MKAVLTFILLVATSVAQAKEHRVAAGGGALQDVIASGDLASGDRVVLEDGWHGSLVLNGASFDPPLTFGAAPDARAEVSGITIENSEGVNVTGLIVRPSAVPSPRELVNRLRNRSSRDETLVSVKSSRAILLDALDVATTEDTDAWSKEDWIARARSGMGVSGQRITVRNSSIRNVHYGISASATDLLVENNHIAVFSGDGIRGLGDDAIYTGNHIETCVKVDDHHDDGFQAWTRGPDRRPGTGVIRNVGIENNRIENGSHKFSCVLQGIGLFDGIYENWVIAGNVIVTDHWHGITVMGARNVEVTRNIVVDAREGKPGPPWISITAHKDGRVPENSVVHGNTTQRDLGSGCIDFRCTA